MKHDFRFISAATIALSLAAVGSALAVPRAGLPIGPPAGVPTHGMPASVPPVRVPMPITAPQPQMPPQAMNRPATAPDMMRGRTTVGRVTAFSGTTLTLMLPTGVTKTFTVDAHAFGQLKPKVGQNLAVRSEDGSRVGSAVVADQTIRGTVASTTRDSVTLTLPNGRTETLMVASQAATRMNLTPGSKVVVTTHDGGMSAAHIDTIHH